MKRLFLSLVLMGIALTLVGQTVQYGNDWYKTISNQPFIKILVTEDGVYRVSASQLSNAGFDLTGVEPNTLRLYFRGQEVPRYLNKTTSGDLDYLEFFGKRNDGLVDSLMYRNNIVGTHDASGQPNKEFSLFSDTAAYFLTYAPGQQGRRYFDYLNILYAGNPEDGYTYEGRLSFDPGNPNASVYVVSGGSAYDSFNALNSDYILGEGYVSRASFGQADSREFTIPTPGALNDGTPVNFKARVFGRSNTTHRLRISIDGSGTPMLDTSWNSNQIYVKTYVREITRNVSANTKMRFEALGTGAADNNHLCWASVTYRRDNDLQGETFTKVRNFDKSSDAYFRFTNVDGNDSVIVYDLTNQVRAKGLVNNGTAQVIVPSFGPGKRQLYVTTDKGIKTPVLAPSKLSKLFDPARGAEFVIVTNRKLAASAEAYKNYRDTATVTPLSATVVYIDEIYDEFGYGTPTSWAIKRFCKYAIDNWTTKPRFFLMWGKGSNDIRTDDRNLVPSFGFPVTDYEYVSNYRFDRVNITPEVGIGRVNVSNDSEGQNYIDKVNDYEHQAFVPWMKEGVFLGGGASVGEQGAISRGINNFIDDFKDISFGGNEIYFQKQGVSTIITGETYDDRIHKGASLIHFFGHSSSNISDVKINDPSFYSNFNQYPFMVAMGCFGGDFTNENSFGERWVKEPRRGAIGYLANSSAGYLSPLKIYGEIFYDIRFGKMPVEPIGNIIKATIEKFADSVPGIQTRNHCRQMNLQGDPAVVLKYPTKVDLAINETSVYFEPGNFTAQDVDYDLNLIVKNQGLAVNDSFTVRVIQRLPDGSAFEHPRFRFMVPTYRDTFTLPLANPVENRLAGRNVYDIWVDSDEEYDEYSEDNNRINLTKIVPGNIPATLYPGEFAVVGEAQNHLDASAFFITRDADVRYLFEIDTTTAFNSPAKVSSGIVDGKAGYVRWDLPFLLQDSVVYFWRVRLVDVEPSFWGSSSFRYLENRNGWAQARAAQFEFNETDKVSIDLTRRIWDFDTYAREIEFEMARRGTRLDRVFSMIYAGSDVADGIIGDNFVVSVIDKNSLNPVYPFFVQTIENPASELSRLKSLIRNARTGDYVMVCATKFSHIGLWDEELFGLMSQIGVSGAMRGMQNEPFMFYGRKGSPVGTATEVYEGGPGFVSRYFITRRLVGPYNEANIASPRIGPAMNWGEAWWDWKSLDAQPLESASLNLLAVRTDGTDSLIAENIDRRKFLDLNALDAKRFPFVQFKTAIIDSVNYTAPQLNNWHVFFGAAPDAVIDPANNFVFESDTVQEGQDIFIQLGAQNVTPFDMDSLLVKFTLIRADRSRLILDSIRTAPLLGDGKVQFSYRFNTLDKNLKGLVDLQVEINPDFDQAERNTFNNIFVQSFFVTVDKTNPMIDVTFDGKHIIDGDIVSPVPEIVIELKDENRFIALKDSSILELQFGINTRNTQGPEVISLNDPRVTFIPGELPENRARIIFRPGLFEPLTENPDGYILRLNGSDARDNTTGPFDTYHEVTFKVIDESTITQVLNYPNPFSTNTRFVYTLTGSELPEVFQIHIYTISGKIVKVVDLVELGEVKFGHNITDYAWDGTDEFGDKIANGVYLYRVILKLPNEELEINSEGTSKYFKNGWGKMYIMR